jgi:hypothetical protein
MAVWFGCMVFAESIRWGAFDKLDVKYLLSFGHRQRVAGATRDDFSPEFCT